MVNGQWSLVNGQLSTWRGRDPFLNKELNFTPFLYIINSMKKKKQTAQPTTEPADYDSAWKDVIEEHFEDFLEFFFPEIHSDIDFSKGYEFLNKELLRIMPESKVGKRHADELVKVHLKDGSTGCICIFIHIEVQGTKETDFEVRIYVYNYRIFDRYKEEGVKVISLVILTDEDENYRPDEYVVSQWGFELRMKIPLVKIIDYKNKKELREKLETSTNPMAMVVKVQLKNYEVKRSDSSKKFDIKRELIRECYKCGYTKKQIRTLLKFIDWILRLPENLEKQLSEEIIRLEEESKMSYVTSWERIARKEGIKEGVKEGVKEGERKGKLETARELIKRGVDINIIIEATGFPREEIEKLAVDAH